MSQVGQELVTAFKGVFEGNPVAHYTWKPGFYTTVERAISEDDVARHLRGEEPGLLSIPVLPSGLCHFAAGDCDRHFETDEPLDHAAVARKITEHGLPLIVTRSKSPKSGHIWLLFKEKDGFSAADARRLIEKYMVLLAIPGEIEIFPKQEKLKHDQIGSGINLPYFGNTRIAFGKDGEELTLEGFIDLVRDRQAYGITLAKRDLADVPSGHGAAGASREKEEHAMLKSTALEFHAKNLEALKQSNEVGHWNDTLNKCAFFAGRCSAAHVFEETEAEIKDAIRRAASATDGWNERQMDDTLDSGWNSGILKPLQIVEEYPEATATLKEFNERYYVVKDFGGKTRICWETIDKTTGSLVVGNQSFPDFYNSYMNQQIQTGEVIKTTGRGTKKEVHAEPEIQSKAEYWLRHRHRRQYEQIVYAPGETLPSGYRNLWQGFAVTPVKGKCDLYTTHLVDNICKGEQPKFTWLTQNMAWKVRNPGEKGYVAPVFKGAEGVGKNMASDPFAFLFGAHAITVTRKEHLAGHFNAHLRACSLVIANEAFFAGDKQHESSLKGLITDDYFMIEAKGVDPVPARNRMSIMIMSNESWVVPAGPEARRFTVFDCGDAQRENTEYFGKLQRQLSERDNAGYKALLHYLLYDVDLNGFDPRKAFKTDALAQQQSLSLRGVEGLWFEILYRGELPHGRQVSSERLLTWASFQHNRKWDGIGAEQLGLFLGKNPRGVSKGMDFNKIRPDGLRVWDIPPLAEARKRWDDRRFKVEWPDQPKEGTPATEWEIVSVGDERTKKAA